MLKKKKKNLKRGASGWEDGRLAHFPVEDHPLKKQQKDKSCKTALTSHTTRFDHPVLHVEAIDASLSADLAVSLDYLALTIWEPDYVTFCLWVMGNKK